MFTAKKPIFSWETVRLVLRQSSSENPSADVVSDVYNTIRRDSLARFHNAKFSHFPVRKIQQEIPKMSDSLFNEADERKMTIWKRFLDSFVSDDIYHMVDGEKVWRCYRSLFVMPNVPEGHYIITVEGLPRTPESFVWGPGFFYVTNPGKFF
jgi:hypothetical protein